MEKHDHTRSDFYDILGSDEHTRAEFPRDADGVLCVVGLLLVGGGFHSHQVPVYHRSVNAMAHLVTDLGGLTRREVLQGSGCRHAVDLESAHRAQCLYRCIWGQDRRSAWGMRV